MTTREPLLLAGTRVTGAEPHLGTLYGWFLPIVEVSKTMSVCVLIADYQSLDAEGTHPLDETAQHLETALRELLPPDVIIVRESRMPPLSSSGWPPPRCSRPRT
jgi:tryptophanyl-tRNA synthetase